jgi:hypothetical protein
MIKKKIIDAPKKWHLVLNETLWAYRMACHGSTKCSPYELVYGHNAVLPWETKIGSRCVMLQDDLKVDEYKHLIMDNLEDLHFHRLIALENIEANKLRNAKYYDKKVRDKQFCARDLVWKVILPIGSKDNNYGKWSPNWEGPYRIVRRVPSNAYIYETLEGEKFSRAINDKFSRSTTQAFGLIHYSQLVKIVRL